MPNKTVAIIGASSNPKKYGNISVRAHLRQGYTVYPVNPRESAIEGLPCYPSIDEVPTPLDRVSLYVSPEVGLTLIDAIAKKKPTEVWLNPGAESNALIEAAQKLGLHVIVACSIVDLGVSPSQV